MRGAVRARVDEDQGRNQEAKAKVHDFLPCRRSEYGEQAHRERPDVCGHNPLTSKNGQSLRTLQRFCQTLTVRNIVKKISTEGLFPCGVVEPQVTTQDVEGAVNEGAKTQVGIDDMQLFVCEVIVKNFEEVFLEDIYESADRCHEPEKSR